MLLGFFVYNYFVSIKHMIQKRKTTPKEDLFHIIARNVADIKDNMATKDDLKAFATKIDLEDMERRLSVKIEAVDEKLDTLEEVDIRNLQRRVYVLEKDVKQIKHKHV